MTDIVVPIRPLTPRLRDVAYGVGLSIVVGTVVFTVLAWSALIHAGTRPADALLEPTVWTGFVVVLFELFWVTRLVFVRGSGNFSIDLGLRFELVDLGYGFAAWVALFVGSVGLDRFVLPYIAPGANDPQPFNPLADYVHISPLLKVVQLVTIGLLVPLAEEMLFRGVLLMAFSRWIGPIGGIVSSSIVFGALHLESWTAHDLAHVLWATLAGLIFGVMRVGTDRLGPGIVAHAMQNSLVVALMILGT